MSYFTPVYNKPFTKVIGINDLLYKIHKGGRTAGRTYLENEINNASKNALAEPEIEQLKMLLEVVLAVPAQSSYNAQWEATTALFKNYDANGLLAPGAYFKNKYGAAAVMNNPNYNNPNSSAVSTTPVSIGTDVSTSTGISKWVYISVGSALLIGTGLFVYFKFIRKNK